MEPLEQPLLRNLVIRAPAHRNPVGDGHLHPTLSPEDEFERPRDDEQAIELFIEQIGAVDDSDYGDYMRRVNLYILELKDQLRYRRIEILRRLDELQYEVQFVPEWSTEATRPLVARAAEDLRRLLQKPAIEATMKEDRLARVGELTPLFFSRLSWLSRKNKASVKKQDS